ncbi:hypothetical protein [Motilimonas sp. E26]|uniref:hypothetical protein n=1 Tax=Motilimonas sp. E26 TaxID=2865674 RepID=UPI001E402F26|nr:hypothetical protein [Motilimonas sp. E26]MCE0559159.1 hypothetical protein [Motilimonas sp. E26]
MNINNCASKLALSGFLLTILLGALAAATLIGLQYSGKNHGFNIPQIENVIAHYHQSQLVGALKGPMYQYVADDDDIVLIADWIKQGAADNEQFQQQVLPILEYDCQSCHSRGSTKTGAIPSLPLSNYQDVSAFTEPGYSWQKMARSAHIHLFGIAFIILPLTLLMAQTAFHSTVKNSLISVAWLALWVDIASWWLSKYSVVFVYSIVIAGGIELGVIALMCVLSLYHLWWKNLNSQLST